MSSLKNRINKINISSDILAHPLVELVMSYLVFISVAIVVMDYTLPISGDLRATLYIIDGVIVLVLLLDLIVRAFLSGNPSRYIASNAYEIPALIPLYTFELLQQVPSIAGLVRLLRLLRLLRMILLFSRGPTFIKAFIEASRKLQFPVVLGALTLTVITAAFTAYVAEVSSGSSGIKSFWEALWWALTTVTTVGYGDIVPETPAGRVIGALTMLIGIGVYSAFIGVIAAALTQIAAKTQRGESLEELKSKIEKLGELDQAELEKLLEEIKEQWTKIRKNM